MLLQRQYVAVLVALSCLHGAAPRMPLETQEDYLNHLYLQVKNRPLRNGELNLLPDGNLPGFANTVRCVTESEEGRRSLVVLRSFCTRELYISSYIRWR